MEKRKWKSTNIDEIPDSNTINAIVDDLDKYRELYNLAEYNYESAKAELTIQLNKWLRNGDLFKKLNVIRVTSGFYCGRLPKSVYEFSGISTYLIDDSIRVKFIEDGVVLIWIDKGSIRKFMKLIGDK